VPATAAVVEEEGTLVEQVQRNSQCPRIDNLYVLEHLIQ
jgi:hypothetical protein